MQHTPQELEAIGRKFGEEQAAEVTNLLHHYDTLAREEIEKIRLQASTRIVVFFTAFFMALSSHRNNDPLQTMLIKQALLLGTGYGLNKLMDALRKAVIKDLHTVFTDIEARIPSERRLVVKEALDTANITDRDTEPSPQQAAAKGIRTVVQEAVEKLAPFIAGFFG